MDHKKIVRAVTVSQSLTFCRDVMIDMRRKGYEMIAVASPGPELKSLREEDEFRCIAVPMERHISIVKDLKSLYRLIKVFHKERPYIVHSMTPKAGLLCMVAAWITRVPRRVHTFTGLVWPTATGITRRILMFTDWITCACATHVIPEGKGVMDDLHRCITHKPMKVLGYGNVRGVDMEFWRRDNADGEMMNGLVEPDKFTFLFVGRIVKDKGINELVEAFVRITEKRKNVRLLLVGRFEDDLDPVSDLTRKKIDECENIVYVGTQRGRQLLACYAASDCFVFPSYREGFPNTVLEAGAMELPSIVTDINGSREIIENGVNGLIVPAKDVDALLDAMNSMVDDNGMRERMRRNARGMIASRFEQGFVRKCLMDFYDTLID